MSQNEIQQFLFFILEEIIMEEYQGDVFFTWADTGCSDIAQIITELQKITAYSGKNHHCCNVNVQKKSYIVHNLSRIMFTRDSCVEGVVQDEECALKQGLHRMESDYL